MSTLLVPTDFSPLSKNAVHFAVGVANHLDWRIILTHVVNISTPVTATIREKVADVEAELIGEAEDELRKLTQEVSAGLRTTEPARWSVVKSSSITDAIGKEAQRWQSGLIVMGTGGAKGIMRTVLGSNTTAVIEGSEVPVLVVPEDGEFSGFGDIAYASDMKDPENDIRKLIPFAEKFGSLIHLVHVRPDAGGIDHYEERIREALLKTSVSNVVTRILVDGSVDAAIDRFVTETKPDLLAMFTHDLNFYEKVLDRSTTRKVASQGQVPLLAFRR